MADRAIVITFGRFNPPTKGHQALLQQCVDAAARIGADVRVYPSVSQDPLKNPLPFADKVEFLQRLFPNVTFNTKAKIHTPFDAFMDVARAGYRRLVVVVGSDRLAEFKAMGKYLVPPNSPKYNATKHVPMNRYDVLTDNARRTISATQLRQAARNGNFAAFLKGTPTINVSLAMRIYKKVRHYMALTEQHIPVDPTDLRLDIFEKDEQAYFVWSYVSNDHKYNGKLERMGRQMTSPLRLTIAYAGSKQPIAQMYVSSKGAKVIWDRVRKGDLSGLPLNSRPVMEAAATPTRKTFGDVRPGDILYDTNAQPYFVVHRVDNARAAGYKVFTGVGVRNYTSTGDTTTGGHKSTPVLVAPSDGKFPQRPGMSYDGRTGVREEDDAVNELTKTVTLKPTKPPTDAQRLKVQQDTEKIQLQQRQANQMMAAKLRDVQQKARDKQTHNTAPKSAAKPATT